MSLGHNELMKGNVHNLDACSFAEYYVSTNLALTCIIHLNMFMMPEHVLFGYKHSYLWMGNQLLSVTSDGEIGPSSLQRPHRVWWGHHRENSLVTQTTPEPTPLSWGGWPCENFFPKPWSHCKACLIALIGPLRPYCSQALWSCSGVSQKLNLLKTCIDLETVSRIVIPSTLHIELKVEWNF